MILWNEELIDFAHKYWKPKVTVLSVVDCPVRYDTYRRGVVAVPNDRTGIITMPSCEEAARLGQYAKYSGWAPLMTGRTEGQQAFQFTQPFPVAAGRIPAEIEHIPLSGIHTVLTVEDIIAGRVNSGFGIVFATVTKLPLDLDDSTRVLLVSCSNCQRRMQSCKRQQEEGIADRYPLFICGTSDCPFMGQPTEPLCTDRVMIPNSRFCLLSANPKASPNIWNYESE
nr:unnamed protein product [Spirometra erinaceieuropaei]